MAEKKDFVPKTYTFDLDLKPEERWTKILADFKDKYAMVKETINKRLEEYGGTTAKLLAAKLLMKKDKIPYYNEIKAIAKTINIETIKLIFMQLMYEASSACTTVVTKINDKNAFLRTMDWELDFLRDLTVVLEVIKNKKVLFYAITWVGCVGMFTAYVPDKFACAINYRRITDASKTEENVKAFLTEDNNPASFLLRETLTNESDVGAIFKKLESSNIISPCYYTFFNFEGESQVITRNPTYDSKSTRSSSFLVQTNCDHNKTEPNIMWSIERRDLIAKSIKSVLNNYSSVEAFTKDMYVSPVINEFTIYKMIIYNDGKKYNYDIIGLRNK